MKKENEIDITKVFINVIQNWKSLIICISISAILGIIVALNTPKTYKASVILAPELGAGSIGLNSSLADMASNFGIDLGSKNSIDAIYPDIYPDIFSSTDFVMQLFDIKVVTTKDAKIKTYKEHLLHDMKSPFWTYPSMWLQKLMEKKKDKTNGENNNGVKNPLIISKNDAALCMAIANSISCLVDKKTSIITISVQDQDPMVAAIIADTLQSKLQAYITDYRTKKARQDFQYYKSLTEKSKKRYISAQRTYAGYADANMDAELQAISTKRDQLENEMQLRYNIYNQMATQMQQAQAKIQERTPAFTILDHARMPYKPSSRPRIFTVLIFIILGIICDSVWILLKGKKTKEAE